MCGQSHFLLYSSPLHSCTPPHIMQWYYLTLLMTSWYASGVSYVMVRIGGGATRVSVPSTSIPRQSRAYF